MTIAIPRRFREDPRQTGPASPNGATVTFRAAEASGLLFMLLTRYRPQVDGPENGGGLRGWWVELHMVGLFGKRWGLVWIMIFLSLAAYGVVLHTYQRNVNYGKQNGIVKLMFYIEISHHI